MIPGVAWRPLLEAVKLPYRRFHATRHSYATWMLEAGADIRWVRDQLGHASIVQTESVYGHLEREHHEQRVNLDEVLAPRSRASTGVHAEPVGGVDQAQLSDFIAAAGMVEGKGFEPSTSALRTPRSPN